jgi:FKBP-type peptidyl-prolyl cis-trans isomerase FklB
MHIPRKSFLSGIGVAAAALVFAAYGAAGQTTTHEAAKSSQATAAHKSSAAKTAQAPPAAPSSGQASALPTTKQNESYALGMNIARRLESNKADLDQASLLQGIQDELDGKAKFTDDQAVGQLKALSAQVHAEAEAKQQATAEANMKEGETFLAANKAKPGVVALPSGLQYKIEKEGTGPKPTAGDTVVCNYRGTFIDGKEFDSSYKRGKPASFPVGHVIKGWTEALQLMPVGSKWELFIPPDLAYGPRGAGGVIGPDQTLVFQVELLSIQGK